MLQLNTLPLSHPVPCNVLSNKLFKKRLKIYTKNVPFRNQIFFLEIREVSGLKPFR